MGSEPVKVVIRGKEYPSLSAASRALGITVQAVWEALEKGRLDDVGLRRSWTVLGKTYTMIKDIAADAGLHHGTTSRLLKTNMPRLEAAIRKKRDAL